MSQCVVSSLRVHFSIILEIKDKIADWSIICFDHVFTNCFDDWSHHCGFPSFAKFCCI